MNSIPFIKEMLSKPFLRVFLSDTVLDPTIFETEIGELCETVWHMRWRLPREDTEDQKVRTINELKTIFRKFGISRREILGFQGKRKGRKLSQWSSHRDLRYLKTELDHCIDKLVSCNYVEQIEVEGELGHKVDRDALINSLHDIKSMEELLLDNSNCFTNDEKSQALLLITAIPALCEFKDCYKMLRFLFELFTELDNLPELICKACEGQPQAFLLIGSLLSVKPRAYNTWNRVKNDLVKIKESNNGASDNYMWDIYTYCYDDLSISLTPCFLYLACYPMNYEIPARSLTEIWIAEDFVDPQDGETIEETANKYLEQLVQRSLVWVSKRSISGAIKFCRVRQCIHEFCIKKSCEEEFLVANPKWEEMGSLTHVAFYNDDKKQYTGEEFKEFEGYVNIDSLLCFDFDTSVLRKIKLLPYVLELRKSLFIESFIRYNYILKYLGLRGSNISKLPNDIGGRSNLKTLDVRDTNIDILPESLWYIKTLRHVYVNPSPQIKGPLSTANIDDLQILKTVAVHESWLENPPLFLGKLRKLALSNRDNPNSKSNPYWKPISDLLSHMVNLLSMAIIGDIVPSELVDMRAFPNLETVKSIKLEGEWRVRKLLIDNIKFPPNLVKLTLIKSDLKEDPMSVLERLQSLKYLSLQDGAYTGKKMVFSANGFPQLQLLELLKLENLEIWEVKPKAMAQLTTMRVVQCPKLENFPNLEHVTDQESSNSHHTSMSNIEDDVEDEAVDDDSEDLDDVTDKGSSNSHHKSTPIIEDDVGDEAMGNDSDDSDDVTDKGSSNSHHKSTPIIEDDVGDEAEDDDR